MNSLRKLAREAHAGTSFVPERRADQVVQDAEAHIEEMRAWIVNVAGEDAAPEILAEYRAGYLRRLRALLAAQSRTISPMITGPARFPTRTNEKRLNTVDKRRRELVDFTSRARRRIARDAERANLPDDPSDALRAKVAKLTELLELKKAVNKIVRKKKLSDDEKVAAIIEESGLSEATARMILKPDDCGRVGFPGYELTSLRGKIKRLEAELRVVESSKEREPLVGDGWQIEEDIREGRVRIFFDEKPPEAVRSSLKRHGFRWARSVGAWQRQLTDNARIAARLALGFDPHVARDGDDNITEVI